MEHICFFLNDPPSLRRFEFPECRVSPEVYSKNLQAGPIFTCQSNADMAALTLDQALGACWACGLWRMG